jgi:glucosyl-dolichyl phosphate glucuronosyltransferase
MSNVSVIICAYTEERWNDLVAAVESVRGQTLTAKEIIVVVDHNQQLLERVQHNLPGVIAVENTEVRGLSGARNSGIAVAGSDIIAFLDDDAVASPNWLMSLNEGFSDPQVLGVGGAVLPLWLSEKAAWLPEEFYWVVGCTYRGMPEKAGMIRNPIGANMAFRREVFDTVGGFQREIGRVGKRPLGCEETEMCIRACQHWPQRGFLYQPQASVFHRVPGSRTNWRYFYSRCYFEGISKAFVSGYVGARDGLASERTYTLQVLPQGVGRGLVDAFLHHDLSGFGRVGAIVSGLALTVAGYCAGRAFSREATSRAKITSEGVSYAGFQFSEEKVSVG